jgi:hypothetical protein
MERKERWFHVFFLLALSGIMIPLGERSFVLWFMLPLVGLLIYANNEIDKIDDKIERELIVQIRLGRAPALKYETTAILQHYEEILQHQPYDMKARMWTRIASKRLDRIVKLEKLIKEKQSEKNIQ